MLVAIAVAVAAVTTAIAVFIDWLPEQASEERQGIDFVLWLTIGICIAVFAVVAAISVYAGLKFRVRPDDDSDGPPIHGHTGIEIVWTAVPTVLVTIIAVASAIVLAQNDRAGDNPLRVNVLAQQFAWSFEYPDNGGVTSPNLYLPVDRSTKLYLTARENDVIHSFWVPEFGQKQDVVPGIVTTLVITPTKEGEYRLVCTELCGLGHALMRSKSVVVSASEFEQWVRGRAEGGQTGTGAEAGEGGEGGEAGEGGQTDTGGETGDGAGGGEAGEGGQTDTGGETGDGGEGGAEVEQLFVSSCGSCHTLTKAQTEGNVGPNLDEVQRGRAAIENQIRHGGGGMPAFEGQLSDAQIESLVQYLTGSDE